MTTVDEVMGFLKWMPGGYDAIQEVLNADKVRCGVGQPTAPGCSRDRAAVEQMVVLVAANSNS